MSLQSCQKAKQKIGKHTINIHERTHAVFKHKGMLFSGYLIDRVANGGGALVNDVRVLERPDKTVAVVGIEHHKFL